jgi:integrase
MIVAMSRPWRNPATGVLYYRGRLPADLKKTVAGQKLMIDVAGEPSTVKLVPIFKISLRTKDSAEARLRHASVQSQLLQRWAAARKGAVSLSHREITALAGVWYRDLVLTHQDEPGDADGWSIFQDHLFDGLAYLDPTSDGTTGEPYDPKQATRILSRQFSIDDFLTARGLNLDEATRTRLIAEVAYALVQGAETLKRRASGDYGADRVADRFPAWQPEKSRVSPHGASGPRLSELLEGWAKESKPAQSTLALWRSYVATFTDYIGREEALSIQRADILKWKQHLIELENSPKTINDSKLAALRVAFRWGVDNELVPSNPAAGVSVRHRKKEKMLGFEKHQAATILRAAAQSSNPVRRWVPLLCAQSGARVSEVCQLRGDDVRCEDGIHYMHFRPEAGGLKNPTSERKVPLHPHAIEAGFVEFAERRGRGPLFYDPTRRRPGAKKPQPKIVAKDVARWVHTLGIEVGRRFRKDPNHAWRHLFRTLARDAGVAESVVNAIQGHAAATVGQSYCETLLRTAARAIAQMPLPGVSEDMRRDG